jgi:hypothetical protein
MPSRSPLNIRNFSKLLRGEAVENCGKWRYYDSLINRFRERTHCCLFQWS